MREDHIFSSFTESEFVISITPNYSLGTINFFWAMLFVFLFINLPLGIFSLFRANTISADVFLAIWTALHAVFIVVVSFRLAWMMMGHEKWTLENGILHLNEL